MIQHDPTRARRCLVPMLAVLIAILAVPFPARDLFAQGPGEGNLESAARLISDGTRELIGTEIQMTEAERDRFWQVYEVFDREMDLLGAQYVRLLETYMDRYLRGALTEGDANRLTDEYLSLQIAMLRVRQKYLPEFRKVIGGIRTTQLYQLQNKVKAEVDAALAEVVPLAELES